MIYLRPKEYSTEFKRGTYIVRGAKSKSCPKCNGRLGVHGTCSRRMRTLNGRVALRLRVMKCGSCGRTHRELPPFLVPYKRYSMEAICEIVCSEPGKQACPASTKMHLIKWLAAILAYAKEKLNQFEIESWHAIINRGSGYLRRLLDRIIREMIRKNIWYSTDIQT